MKGLIIQGSAVLLSCQAIALLGTVNAFSFRKQHTTEIPTVSRNQHQLYQLGLAPSHSPSLVLFQSMEDDSDNEPPASSFFPEPLKGASISDNEIVNDNDEAAAPSSKKQTESIAFYADEEPTTTTNEDLKVSVTEDNSNKLRTAASLFDYDSAYVVFASAIIGVLSGFAVAIFKLSIEAVRETVYGSAFSERFVWWLIPALVGGLGVSLISLTGEMAPGLRGTANEVDALSLDVQKDQRFKNALRFLRKPLAAILTLGSGCSLGPEGPSVEVGMTMSRLCMPPSLQRSDMLAEVDAAARLRRNRLLLSAGAAAGVAAGFNAPLAGVFFALEILQQNLPPLTISGSSGPLTKSIGNNRKDQISWQQQVQQDYLSSGTGSITAILIASVLSALVSQVYLGEELALSVPSYQLNTPLVELPLYLLLGVVSGVVAGSFSALAQLSKRVFDGLSGPKRLRNRMKKMPQFFKPILGGLFCGVMGLAFPQILFFGYETLNALLANTSMSLGLILSLLAAKILATAVSAGSGLVGGTFAPSLFLGGMTGAAFHNIVQGLFKLSATASPFFLADVQAYALVGAAGVLSALFRAPLTATLLLFELTRDYNVILPLMATAGVGSLVGDIVERTFEEKRRDRDSSVSWGDLATDDNNDGNVEEK
ncbi:unnamed protein product [Cylindrotheca closterium]|uniref:Chloride channel protein n=1 Tax=Cylindrotheca closterium TaxID=2856 RepID=A0AAD2CMX9_9STRA|nr:unnamed protein product [Cylindrotheca closterium]